VASSITIAPVGVWVLAVLAVLACAAPADAVRTRAATSTKTLFIASPRQLLLASIN